jgi:hypothetical protein
LRISCWISGPVFLTARDRAGTKTGNQRISGSVFVTARDRAGTKTENRNPKKES